MDKDITVYYKEGYENVYEFDNPDDAMLRLGELYDSRAL
jgi:hypothetical protein